jgi:hypothetical protein
MYRVEVIVTDVDTEEVALRLRSVAEADEVVASGAVTPGVRQVVEFLAKLVEPA